MKNFVWIIIAAAIVLGGYILYSGRSVQEIAVDASNAVNAPQALDSATDVVGDAVEATGGAVATAVEATAEAAAAAADAVSEAASDAADAAATATEDAVTATRKLAQDHSAPTTAVTTSTPDTAETTAAPATDEAQVAATNDVENATNGASTTIAGSSQTAPQGVTPTEQAATAAQSEVVAEIDGAAQARLEAQANAEGDVAQAPSTVTTDTETTAATLEQLTTVDGFDLEKVQTIIDESDLPATQKTLLKRGLEAAGTSPEALREILIQVRQALNL